MMPIDPTELSGISTDLARILPNTCNIVRPGSSASDGAGGFTEAYTTVASAVACSVYPASNISALAINVMQNSENRVIGDWIILLPTGTVVKNRDRITIIESGRVYEVDTHDGGSSYSQLVNVKATLVE